MSKDAKFFILLLSIMLPIGIAETCFLRPDRKNERVEVLKKSAVTAIGYVENVYTANFSGVKFSLQYTFMAEGKKHEASKKIVCVTPHSSYKEAFKGKSFLVVYSKNDPNVHMMLLGKREYETFGINFPDSLTEISEKFFNCESGLYE